MKTNTFSVGLRLHDVARAADLYTGLGVEQVGELPSADGQPLLRILQRQGVHLVVESLTGAPKPDSDRESQIQRGPRGLGVVLGFEVDNLDLTYQYAIERGCTITCDPMDEEWGQGPGKVLFQQVMSSFRGLSGVRA